MGEDGGDVKAARALDIHEETVGGLNETFELVHLGLISRVTVKEINGHLVY